jgi:hypothetical protein
MAEAVSVYGGAVAVANAAGIYGAAATTSALAALGGGAVAAGGGGKRWPQPFEHESGDDKWISAS